MAKDNVLIIGGGPAGCSAALTLRMRDKDVTLLSSGGGALQKAKRVDNYPGLRHAGGEDMLLSFREQAREAGAVFVPALSRLIQRTKRGFTVLAGEELYTGRALILCTGVDRVSLIEGEEQLVGAGVSYCATCDGMLYRGGRVAVIAQDASFAHDVAFLRGICDAVDYFKERPHALPQGENARPGKPLSLARAGEKVRLVTDEGEDTYDCVFILRPAVKIGQLLPGLETNGAAIRVDAEMRASLPGVFAAGDCTGEPYQIARAVGQGNIAALSCARYLSENPLA